ncbi:MAG: hypothetical protein ACYC27_05355 [Armatimonadota bacterium]
MSDFISYLDRLNIGPLHPDMEMRLHRLYDEICRYPADLSMLKSALVDILAHLTTPEGRTDRNCRLLDKFVFFLCYEDDPIRDRKDIPDDFRLVIEDIGMGLHDAIDCPDIAANFESLPEQLLERAENLIAS